MSDIASSSRRVFSVAGLFLASSILIGCGEEKPADSGAAGAAPSATTTADKDASVVKKGGRQLNADGPSARELRNEKLKASGGQ